jgi:hypothetical protein
MEARVKRVQAKPNGTRPIRAYIAKDSRAVVECRSIKDTYTDRPNSVAKTKSVAIPSEADV